MKETLGEDIFDKIVIADAICITTNCSVLNGINPMGALAGAAAKRWAKIPKIYGKLLHITGNVPVILGNISKDDNTKFISILDSLHEDFTKYTLLIAFPTMHEIGMLADFNLVERSANLLVEMANLFDLNTLYVGSPRHRSWTDFRLIRYILC